MSTHVFVYGSLLFPEVLAAVTGRDWPMETATLDGHVRVALRDAVYPVLFERAGTQVEGRLVRDVDLPTLGRLDRFEDTLYDRLSLTVRTVDEQVDAWVYVLAPGNDHVWIDTPWDPERFRERELTRYLEMCRRFYDEDVADLAAGRIPTDSE